MKKILGLDLGTTSIGWAFVNEAENTEETSSIQQIGVRVNPLSTEEQTDFEKGKSLTLNADRTAKRSARRNLERFKLRRRNLIALLIEAGIISETTELSENGKGTTFETLALRAKAANERIEKNELARIFLSINKKRGYKSSRKAKNEDEGQAIDGMAIAKRLYEEDLTPGQLCLKFLKEGKKILPDFYRSDLQAEFVKVWEFQKRFYPEILTEKIKLEVEGKGQRATSAILKKEFDIYTAENKGTREEKRIQAYEWRSKAISEKLDISEVAFVLAEINNNLNASSGYLGAISDRSKELYFNKETVGQYLYKQIRQNPHTRTKGQVFYRQDYLDEFESIWETQRNFHPELTEKLKSEIRDVVIFYQRRLKSQKGLISFCEFESKQKLVLVDGTKKLKTIGARVAPKASPLFQEFKIWQNLSNVIIKNKKTKELFEFGLETKELLFEELNLKGNLKKAEVLKLVTDNPQEWELNYSELEGNRTNQVFYEAYQKIIQSEGSEDFDFKKLTAREVKEVVKSFLESIGVNSKILEFDPMIEGADFEKQLSFQLWHLLYSYEGDNSTSGNERLLQKLESKFGFKREYALVLSNVVFQDDYSSLSAKAIRKIFPFIKESKFSEACELALYNHSKSLTKEANEKRSLKPILDLLPKNSLRNPVVEKILNQMVNLINTIIKDPTMGVPDEIRIELARELKKNAKEREEMTQQINKAKDNHDKYRKIIQSEFGVSNPTRNDLIRYKLYIELESVGYKTLYSNTYISKDKLFSKEFDIEHIIPKSRLFDDSFSNKTLESRQVNIEKGEDTAYDFVSQKYDGSRLNQFTATVELLFKDGKISKAKYKKLLMQGNEIGEGFIERDLRESQYIAKKAKEMLFEICRSVLSTSGSITDKLREDWDLVNVMKELNLEKYRSLGLTEFVELKDGNKKEQIIDWTKRNDHRHHAMDALTVAFTKHNHIQYLNNLNARKNENSKNHAVIMAIEQKEVERDENNKKRFKAPMLNFRSEAKKHLENTLISFKAKNKVVTRNKNKVQGSKKIQLTLTPRGQLHKETIYGLSKKGFVKEEKVSGKFDRVMIDKISNPIHKMALAKRLEEFGNDAKRAFTGKNAPDKNPIWIDQEKTKKLPEKVKILSFENQYTIKKEVSPDLKLEKVVDEAVRRILQQRLSEFENDPKKAFVNLDLNPIWLNKEKGICVKSVTITGVNNAEALHTKKSHLGEEVLDEYNNPIPVDFVSTGNNHHVAIYRDASGNLQEEVVSFYEAVARVNQEMQIINKNHKEGWEFLFTMKQNEMFVFPSFAFNPKEIDLLDLKNYVLISPNLYRVQKFTIKDYFFRHHLETNVDMNGSLKNIAWRREGLNGLNGIIKVRLNHLGQIVKVGE